MFVLLLAILAICVVFTYIVPSGEYARVEVNGRSVVQSDSFQYTDASPISFMGFLNSIHTGMVDSASIMFFVLIIGGSYGILSATGAMEAFIVTLARTLGHREKWLIPIMMLFFAAGGSLIGMFEETLPYIAILVPLAVALGFDAMTGAAIVLLGASVGFTSAVMNPFTIGIAQGIAELPPFSGMGLRYRHLYRHVLDRRRVCVPARDEGKEESCPWYLRLLRSSQYRPDDEQRRCF